MKTKNEELRQENDDLRRKLGTTSAALATAMDEVERLARQLGNAYAVAGELAVRLKIGAGAASTPSLN